MKKPADTIIILIQKALNAYLGLDPESKTRLEKLQGKIVAIELLKMNLLFHFVFTGAQIELKLGEVTTADTTIKGTPLRLLQTALSREKRQEFFADDVSIEGNIDVGLEVIALFDHLEIDKEEFLSQAIGDVAAHQVGNIARQVVSWVKLVRTELTQDISEFVHEEKALFPPSEALKDFFQDIDELRMDADRLQIRVEKLVTRLATVRGEA